MLTLYHGRTSVCAIKARIALAEKKLAWQGRLLTLQGDQFDPAYIYNPLVYCGTAGVIPIEDIAKGLEFRAVAVMACDDEVLPLQARIESVGDDADLQEVYDTERHLLYVACTRAREHLHVSGVEPMSEFVDDLKP